MSCAAGCSNVVLLEHMHVTRWQSWKHSPCHHNKF